VLYFFQRAQVESLFRAQAEAADARRANLEVAFDYASPFGAWIVTRRPAHRQLGTTFHWTLHNPSELRSVDPRLELVEDSNVFLNAMGTGARQLDALYHLVSGSSLADARIFAAFPLLNVNIQTGGPESARSDWRLAARAVTRSTATERRMLQQCVILNGHRRCGITRPPNDCQLILEAYYLLRSGLEYFIHFWSHTRKRRYFKQRHETYGSALLPGNLTALHKPTISIVIRLQVTTGTTAD